MDPEIQQLRQQTLTNNLIWLQSFGCRIRSFDNLICVDHPDLPEYVARLLFGSANEALEGFRFVLEEMKRNSSSPYVYVDELSSSVPLESALKVAGFALASINVTIASFWDPIRGHTQLVLRAAGREDFERWSTLYSQGFHRSVRETEIDRMRWRRSFESQESVRHWFFAKGTEEVGVCQTCDHSSVIGIYSFTLHPTQRGLKNVRGAMCALRAILSERGQVRVYFERLHTISRRSGLQVRCPSSLLVVRRMVGYRKTS